MTPEVTQETGRRRTTSEGQYQSSHDNRPVGHSPDFVNNLALNPGGRPREVKYHLIEPDYDEMSVTMCRIIKWKKEMGRTHWDRY